jgi:two-component system KDP operon response regulator KdpE
MSQESIHTLLVTPDQEWPSLLYGHLWQNGFAPLTIAPSGDSALDLFYQVSPRLVLIDLHLPDCNVVDLCVEILLAQPAVKVVLMTESEAELPVAALHAGVSGCINRQLPLTAWPGLLLYIMSGGMAFNHSVVETVLAEAWSAQKRQPMVTIGSLRIDLARRLVVYGGRRIQLTPREFALLTCLARNMDRVVTFDQLLNEAWGYDADDGTPAQVRLYIARLRQKMLGEAQTPDFIHSERGIGYRLLGGALRRAIERPEPHVPHENGAYPVPAAALPH